MNCLRKPNRPLPTAHLSSGPRDWATVSASGTKQTSILTLSMSAFRG